MVMLAKSPAVSKYDLSSVLCIYCGAAPLSKEISDIVYERLNVLFILQGFGMSEMTLSVLQQTPGRVTNGSIGTLRPGTWGKIIDPDTQAVLGPNERGEMCFKGSAIMKGYISNTEATKGTIDANGWLHTGDIGYYNEEEDWFIVDRLKELIKYKGYQVPPAELEAVLLTHSQIIDAGVVGIPDEATGELAFAFVVKKKNSQLTEQEVLDFITGIATILSFFLL